MEYREIIAQEIERVKQLHGTLDPYWNAVIKGLIADLQDYEKREAWEQGRITEFDRIWRMILKQFFGEDLEL